VRHSPWERGQVGALPTVPTNFNTIECTECAGGLLNRLSLVRLQAMVPFPGEPTGEAPEPAGSGIEPQGLGRDTSTLRHFGRNSCSRVSACEAD